MTAILSPGISRSLIQCSTRKWDFIGQYVPRARALIDQINPRMVVTLWATPGCAVLGKAVSVKNSRGMFHPMKDSPIPYFQTLSVNLVSIQPDNRPIMEADLNLLKRVKDAGWDKTVLDRAETNYERCFDLTDLLVNRPGMIAVDTEATGLDTMADNYRVITVQIADQEGKSRVCRICPDYFPDHPLFQNQTEADIRVLRSQIKTLTEDPRIVKVLHNGKYDFMALRSIGIEMTD